LTPITRTSKSKTNITKNSLTQLRLLNPVENTLDRAVNIAMSFEAETFKTSRDQATYDALFKAKLEEITIRRQKQAQSMEQQLQAGNMGIGLQARGIPQVMPGQAFNQPGVGFGPQMQRQIAQNTMGMMHQPQHQQVGPGMIGNPMQNHMQIPPGMQNGGMNGPSPDLTPEETAFVNQMIMNILNKASPQDREKAKAQYTTQQLLIMQQRRMDPLRYYAQQMAIRQIMARRQKQGGQQPPPQQRPPGNPGAPAIGNQQNPVISLINGNTPMDMNQTNFSYGPTNIQEFLRQQASGERAQEAGRQVVPASRGPSSSMNQHPNQMGQNMQQQQQLTGQGLMQAHRPGNQQPNRPNVPNQGMPQLAGTGMNMGQIPPQQSPAMPHLNQPMNSMSRPSSQNQPHKPQATPGQSHNTARMSQPQHPSQNQPNQPNQPGNNNLQRPIMNPQLQAILQRMPKEQRGPYLQALKDRMHPQNRQSQNNKLPPPSGPNQPDQMGNVPASIPPSRIPSIGPVPSPNLPPNGRNTQLTKEQKAEMDRKLYPKNILNHEIMMQHLPPEVQTWGELKAWCQTHAHVIPHDLMAKIEQLQGVHFDQIRKQEMASADQARQNIISQPVSEAQRPPSQLGPAPPAQMSSSNTGLSQNGATHAQSRSHGGLMNLPNPLTPQHIQELRARFPPLNQHTDDEIRNIIASRKQQQLQRQINNNNNNNSIRAPNGNQPSQFPNINQLSKPAQPQNGSQATQPTKPQATAQSPLQKTIKRPGEEISDKPNTAPQLNQAKPGSSVQSNAGKLNQPAVQKQMYEAKQQRFKQIREELKRSFVSRPPVPMDAESHQTLREMLIRDNNFITRAEYGALQFYNVISSDESHLRDILRTVSTTWNFHFLVSSFIKVITNTFFFQINR
jgi:hypothetical protein